jgi:hypothetical protein
MIMAVSMACLLALCPPSPRAASCRSSIEASRQARREPRQLAAVRGEIVKITPAARGTLLITIRPPREFAEVTVLARENDLVGPAIGRSDSDLLSLLTNDDRDEEAITAAELNIGDVVSAIFDPASQNKVIEMYVH